MKENTTTNNKDKENTTTNNKLENKQYAFKDVCKQESNKLYYKCLTADPKKPVEEVAINLTKAPRLENKIDNAFNKAFVDNANKKIEACVEELNNIENYIEVITRDEHDKPLVIELKKKNSISNFTGRNISRIALLRVITKLLNGDTLDNTDENILNGLTTIERGTQFIIYKGMSLAELLQKNANAKKSFAEIQEIAKKKGLNINMVSMMVE